MDGAVDLFRTVGREETRVGQMVPGRWAGGFQAWDEDGVYLATGRGVEFGRLLKVPAPDLRALMEDWLPLAVHLVRGVFGTARDRGDGPAARVAHHPRDVVGRPRARAEQPGGGRGPHGASRWRDLNALLHSLGELAEGAITADQFLALDRLRRQVGAAPPDPRRCSSPTPRTSGAWLEDHDVDDAWTLASTLAAADVPVAWLEEAADLLPGAGPDRRPRVGGRHALGQCAALASCARRPAGSPSSSTRCAPTRRWTVPSLQPVDVVEGLESTLVMLQHKLAAGSTVVRDYGADLPRIDAYAGELNQVWTNLIDNAVDAMDGVGTLRITTRAEADAVVVEIADSGPGLDPAVAARAFDAFYTTKDVGKGTGLGLDTARRIVVENHEGTIALVREGDETVVRVRLPR